MHVTKLQMSMEKSITELQRINYVNINRWKIVLRKWVHAEIEAEHWLDDWVSRLSVEVKINNINLNWKLRDSAFNGYMRQRQMALNKNKTASLHPNWTHFKCETDMRNSSKWK